MRNKGNKIDRQVGKRLQVRRDLREVSEGGDSGEKGICRRWLTLDGIVAGRAEGRVSKVGRFRKLIINSGLKTARLKGLPEGDKWTALFKEAKLRRNNESIYIYIYRNNLYIIYIYIIYIIYI